MGSLTWCFLKSSISKKPLEGVSAFVDKTQMSHWNSDVWMGILALPQTCPPTLASQLISEPGFLIQKMLVGRHLVPREQPRVSSCQAGDSCMIHNNPAPTSLWSTHHSLLEAFVSWMVAGLAHQIKSKMWRV